MRSAWLVIGFGVTLTAVLPSGWNPVLVVVSVYYGYTRLVQVFSGWVTVRYVANRSGITVFRGLVGREEKRLSWRSVVSVTVRQTLVQRTLGVAELRITLRATEIASVTIQDLLTGEAARLVRLHGQSRSQRTTPSPRDTGEVHDVAPIEQAEPGRVVTPALRPSDFLLIGVCTGAFVFFLPSVYSGASEILPWFGLSRTLLPSMREIVRLDPVASGLAVAIVAVGSLVYGAAIAWVRYRGFSVTCRPSGALVFAAGLAQREQRVVVSEDVAAYESRRPVLMLFGNRVVLRAVVRGDSGLVTRNLLLPLTRVTHAVEMLQFLTGLPPADLAGGPRRTRTVPVVLVIAAGGSRPRRRRICGPGSARAGRRDRGVPPAPCGRQPHRSHPGRDQCVRRPMGHRTARDAVPIRVGDQGGLGRCVPMGRVRQAARHADRDTPRAAHRPTHGVGHIRSSRSSPASGLGVADAARSGKEPPMTDLLIALCVAAFFGAAWSAGRILPKAVAVCFPVAVLIAVIIVAATGGLGTVRDWFMAGVVICITAIITSAGRGSRRRNSRAADS